MRLTGTLLFSMLCFLPMRAEGAKNTPPLKQCKSGSTYCPICSGCLDDRYPCESASCGKTLKTILLQKKEGAIYSLEEGAIVTCEGVKTLVPIPGTETHWTCGTVKESSKKK